MQLSRIYLFLIIMATFGSFSSYCAELNEEQDFVVFSIPKCGSGLINKFFELSSSKSKLGPKKWLYKYTKPTFRKGQINQWKEIFTPKHKRICKKYLGELLIQLGYEKNYDW